jgi:hypothetical protein
VGDLEAKPKTENEMTTPTDGPVAQIVAKNTFGFDVYEAELLEAGVNLPKGTKLYAQPSSAKFRLFADSISKATETVQNATIKLWDGSTPGPCEEEWIELNRAVHELWNTVAELYAELDKE